MKKLGLVFFEPYARWVRKKDGERLEAGWEKLEGTWRKPKEVASLNEEHSGWANPWILDDGVHELRTNVALRDALQVLSHITAFREFFLAEFGAEWDLKAPTGKLPVILTRTQREFRERMQKASPGIRDTGLSGAAFYFWRNVPLNPCFVTFEPTLVSGQATKVNLEEVLMSVRHEVTHQLAYEYSKHDCDNTRVTAHEFWCVEAIANFMQNYILEKGAWRLVHRKTWASGDGYMEGDFSHCVDNLASLPTLKELFAIRKDGLSVETYHMTATVAYFLLQGEEGEHRTSFLKLLERVHKVRDTAKCFDECFRGVDLKDLQAEWESFVRGITLDPD